MISIDLNGAVRGPATPGADIGDVLTLSGKVESCLAGLRRGGPSLGWVDLPLDGAGARSVTDWASCVPEEVRQVVVMGIGGSSLGPLALYHAIHFPASILHGPGSPGTRPIWFLDNSDPDTVAGVLDALDPSATLHVAITKSGSTAETASQLMIAWERARARMGDAARERFVFVTDPGKGDLRALAGRLGVASFPVPMEVGGRFSVLSAVGLVPAALAGIDPARILAGARQAREACLGRPLGRNPAALLGTLAWLLDEGSGRNVHVVMAYADRLAQIGAWFRQLWAESLGKRREGRPAAGPTPLDARGATDQHSLLQLLAEGPADKLVIFLDVRSRRRLEIPRVFEDLPSFGYLGGRTVGELIDAERRGTEMSLAASGTPTMTISLDEITPESIGGLMYVLEVATAVAGRLYGVNPYDQPGVEQGKQLTCGLLGRSGFEEKRALVASFDAARRPELVASI